jgi:hypothetical protein
LPQMHFASDAASGGCRNIGSRPVDQEKSAYLGIAATLKFLLGSRSCIVLKSVHATSVSSASFHPK